MIPPIVIPEVTDFNIVAVCEFCMQIIFEKDPHACIKYDKCLCAFHNECYHRALKTEGWFVRFWEREAKKKTLGKKECEK